MIPKSNAQAGLQILETVQQPTRTYHWDIEKDRIRGYTDGQIAMKQSNYHILMTERYQHVIYSWNYGVELAELFGKPRNYCVPEIERRVSEALLYDERNMAVDTFAFDLEERDTVAARFLVHTIFGDIEMDLEVPI